MSAICVEETIKFSFATGAVDMRELSKGLLEVWIELGIVGDHVAAMGDRTSNIINNLLYQPVDYIII